MIRVALVDDHPLVRAGLSALIDGEEDLQVVAEADGLEEAVRVLNGLPVDVVLMDLNLGPGPGGAAATAEVLALPDPPVVVVLTTYETEADIIAAMRAGAVGYLLKGATAAELFDGIRAAASGRPALAPTVMRTLVSRSGSGLDVVTEREVEVLSLLAAGLSNKEMAARLLVSEATVKSHLAHLYPKLGVTTRTGAIAEALERRIVRGGG